MPYATTVLNHKAKNVYTDPATAEVVTFDIADGTFEYYSADQWDSYIAQCESELVGEGLIEDGHDYAPEDIIDMIHGDELFWDIVPLLAEKVLTCSS